MPTPIGLVRISASPACAPAHVLGPADADHGQAVDGFGAIDRVTAGHGYAGRCTDRCTALQDFAHHFGRDLVHGHAEDSERHDRFAAHRIDVRNGIGRSDASEVVRIVDHRHEEVRRGDDAGVLVLLPYRGVVSRLGADEKLLVSCHGWLVGQQLLQNRRRELAAATTAVGEACQADLGNVHTLSLRSCCAPAPIAMTGQAVNSFDVIL